MEASDGTKKTERLHMLISPDELEKIEVWRFANRVGTRADAVRKLVKLGLNANSLQDDPSPIEPGSVTDEMVVAALTAFNGGHTDWCSIDAVLMREALQAAFRASIQEAVDG